MPREDEAALSGQEFRKVRVGSRHSQRAGAMGRSTVEVGAPREPLGGRRDFPHRVASSTMQNAGVLALIINVHDC